MTPEQATIAGVSLDERSRQLRRLYFQKVEEKRMPEYDICFVCAKSFEEGNVISDYRVWPSLKPRSAHFRCLMVISTLDEQSKNPRRATP
jgi:hypothetical protein